MRFDPILCAAVVGVALSAAQPTSAAETDYTSAKPGPHKVETKTDLKLTDAARKKDVPLAVCFPKDAAGPFPVVVFSHGAGGDGTRVLPLPEFWASHGYVCLMPTHSDSLSRRNGTEGTAAKAARGSKSEGWIERPKDITFVLDSVGEIEKLVPALKGKFDLKKVGVGGHSLGAYTAQLVGGATVDLDGKTGLDLSDKRVTAVVQLSGQGVDQQGLTKKSWEKMTKPMMSVTGTKDRGAGGQEYTWKEDPFKYSPDGGKYHLVFEGGHHGSFTGKFARNGDQKTIFDGTKAATLAFWDAYLKDDAAAKKYLASDDLPKASGELLTMKRK